MTRLAMFSIANNFENILIFAYGPDENGKFSGWITFGPERNNRPILSTKNIFSTEKDAIERMLKVAEFCKKWAHKDIQGPECAKEFSEISSLPAA